MPEIVCDIISIGDELLIGQVINTNASWIAQELNKSGIGVNRILTISDDGKDITNAIQSVQSEIVLITGGLGPTKDDITKKVLCEYFNSELVFHKPTFDHIVNLFGKRNYPVSDVNKAQADIPDNCIPLFNEHGTAPGLWFEKDGKVIVSMPGVPFEMKSLVTNQVIPRIIKKFNTGTILHKTIMTIGIGESRLAELIEDWANNLPDHIKLAYLPQPGIVRLRLSSKSDDPEQIQNEFDLQIKKLKKLIPDIIYGYDEITMEESIAQLLVKGGKTLATAESCTGGYISHLITSIPGSSEYFFGSVVSYANEVKIKHLGVEASLIEKHGVVSKEVVEQMAIGGKIALGTDYCIATSGIAGPDGGTKDKPVGTVWIAVATPNGVISKLLNLGEHRGRNIRRSALLAMNLLRKELIK